MVFISNANFQRLKISSSRNIPRDFIFEDIEIWSSEENGKIDLHHPFIFSKHEAQHLLWDKLFCQNINHPENIDVDFFYGRINNEQDNRTRIYPPRPPVYHYNRDCQALNSAYSNFVIPQSIIDRGEASVSEFRRWWRDNDNLRQNNPQAFVERIYNRFNVRIQLHEVEERENSGVFVVEDNMSVEDINRRIKALFNSIFTWANENNMRKFVVSNYGYLSFLGEQDTPIRNNNSDFSDEQIKEVLRELHTMKKDIIHYLKLLYQRRYIPNLQFSRTLLENCGFEPCYVCGRNGQKVGCF
jgi:hypothetical protein